MTGHAPTIALPGLPPIAGDELLVIAGETASGKTALALSIARALGGAATIVGADSVQVFRGFDLGSGKPTTAELGGVSHVLLDVAEPAEPFDAARFAALADEAIGSARGAGRTPIVCGGTYLWLKALLFGLADAPPAPPEVRAALQREVDVDGSPALHARLSALDPTTAARLHPNDALRIVRALEVHAVTGRPLSALHAEHGFRQARHRARIVAIRWPRAELDRRIAARVEAMLAGGWVDEVRALIAAGHRDTRPMRSVGYAEVLACIEGTIPRSELASRIVRATRVLARRQRTWLNGAPVEWIDGAALR